MRPVSSDDREGKVDRRPQPSGRDLRHRLVRVRSRAIAVRLVALLVATLGVAALVRTAAAEIFFGDLHAHSELSDDASNPPEAFFLTARDVAGLDFVVLSDHDIFLTADEWEILKATAASFDVPGRFVAFSAIEWSQDFHHLNVYFRGDDEEYCPLRECRQSADFYSFYGPRVLAGQAAAQVNHPADPFFLVPWNEMDDTITTSVEVWNSGSAGSHELRFGGSLWALRAGFRLGQVGVSDDHHSELSPPLLGTGLTGCHAAALTRADLLDALRARRCFATDGERIARDLEVDGTPMGGERSARIGERLAVRVEALATATPVVVEVVRNGDVVATRRCETPICDVSAAVRIVEPNTFVYARVAQAGDGHAWSSPVWVRGECAHGTSCLQSRLVSGGGDGADDCLARWLVRDGAARSAGGGTPRLVCRDGDPACDAGSEPDACTFELGLCFAIDAPTGGRCTAAAADGFEVLLPADAPRETADPDERETRQTLEAMFRATTTSTDKPGCTPPSSFRVPVGARRLQIRTTGDTRVDTDELVLECTAAGPTRRAPLPLLRAGRSS
jgi:hypothetical protein